MSITKTVGLDQYQYLVSVSGRYQWYRFGIGIADNAGDTRPIPVDCHTFVTVLKTLGVMV